MLGAKWIAASATCLIGAGLIVIFVRSLDSVSKDDLKDRILYLLAAGWLILFYVFLTSVLAVALEATL